MKNVAHHQTNTSILPWIDNLTPNLFSTMTIQPESGYDLKVDLTHLLNDSTFHDITIVCADGAEITACRAFLATRSVVFKAMLYGNMQESVSQRVTLGEIQSTAMRIVLSYIHTETIEQVALLPSVAVEAYRAASFFLLPKLMGMVLEQAQGVTDIVVASSLLNEAIAVVPPSEMNMELYDVLLRPFCKLSLSIGDLTSLSENALKFLLTQTYYKDFNTSEQVLMLCAIDWAWERGQSPPRPSKRHEALAQLVDNDEPVMDPKSRIEFTDDHSRSLLQSMSRHLELSLICPHRLKSIMDTVDGLTDTSPQHIAFSHYACTNTRCPTGHPSGFRGTPDSWDRSRLASDLVVSEEGSVIELPGSVEPETVRTARISGAFTSGLCEWDIIVESPGICRGMAASLLGLVGDTFDKFHTHIKHFSPILCMESFNSSCYLLGMDPTPDYGTHLYSGDIVTFHLDMKEHTCSLSINGKNYGIAWRNLPNKVYAAVTLFPEAKYRFRPHSTE